MSDYDDISTFIMFLSVFRHCCAIPFLSCVVRIIEWYCRCYVIGRNTNPTLSESYEDLTPSRSKTVPLSYFLPLKDWEEINPRVCLLFPPLSIFLFRLFPFLPLSPSFLFFVCNCSFLIYTGPLSVTIVTDPA